MEISTAAKMFFSSKQAEGVTARTFQTYKTELPRFFDFLVDKMEVTQVEDITAFHIREFINHLQSLGTMKNITIHRYYRLIRAFMNFLEKEEILKNNPISKVKPPKVENKIPRTFTPLEIKKLLNAFNGDLFYDIRNKCIIALFFSTGIRRNELIELKLQDVNITSDILRVQKGKGMKERHIPIGRAMKRILTDYLKHRQEYLADKNPDCPYLFPSRTGQKMTPSCLTQLFRKLKRELKLQGERISCHTWRHTFAKNYLLNGGDIFSLQKILGHADLETTRVYLELNDQEVKTQFSRYNPLDNKDWLY